MLHRTPSDEPATDPPSTQAPLDGCPRCGAPMLPRIARRTGDAFLGCSRFPTCRGTRSLAAPVAIVAGGLRSGG